MLLLAISLCTGCRASDSANDSPLPEAAAPRETAPMETLIGGSITVTTNRVDLVNDGTFDRYAAAFKAKYPAVENVVFEPLSNYESEIRTRITTGSAGDVLFIPGNIAQNQLGDFFEPVEDVAARLGKLHFKDFKAYEGHVYGIVSGVSVEGIIYNKRAFAKAGISSPPQSLTAFYETCRLLRNAGVIPIYVNYGAQWPMKQWSEILATMMSGRGSFLDEMTTQESPFQLENEFGRALTILRTLIQNEDVEPDLRNSNWEASKQDLSSGKAGMYFLGNWAINQLIATGAKSEDIGFFPFPYDNSGNLQALLNNDWFYAVSKVSTNKETAKAWIRFMVEDSGYDIQSGFIPPQTEKKWQLPQLDEFFAYKPVLFENAPTSPLWYDIANESRIDFFQGEYLQRAAIAEDLRTSFEQLNRQWQEGKARAEYSRTP
ncbi:carbohydrate ABC transporter substrate-binding protein [Paenibacillus whitsoniae]|uniref:Carbohydrate ABC transporter substrate-binding protein n=2 Tax=Paenibacillus whitsoniae TaxID=2496558 RepID=A0A430JJZ7_9BACL|nr:carbohydrate ABC transporter substrate-binding protein [Paenibacillus whitsoniae]